MATTRFLVVDDSATMRRIVINTLKTIGYEDVVEAGDGAEALAQLRSHEIHFVVTDWNMPNMSGLEFTKAVRSDDKLQHLPILMVTTRGVKEDIVEALQARVSSYIVKPFTPPVFKEKIDQLLKLVPQ
ncbi:MAG: response regulator [Ignavibacteriales bacterium]|nr:response regulator [Ignavibacteriales bacterium]